MGRHKFFEAIWTIDHRSKDDKVLFSYTGRNALVNDGEYVLLDAFFRAQSLPTVFYVGLCYGSMSEETLEVNIPGEPVSTWGYSRQSLTRDTTGFPTIELNDGDYQLTTKSLAVTASGGSIGPVNHAFLVANTDSGLRLLSFITLPREITLVSGEQLSFYIKIKAM